MLNSLDPFDLKRFVDAQERIYPRVCSELRNGRKASHWMWFIFPQIVGLGRTSTSAKYAIGSREEAGAYLEHSILGTRLQECTELVNSVEGRSAMQIFGHPDVMKFRSSMTLFGEAAGGQNVFR